MTATTQLPDLSAYRREAHDWLAANAPRKVDTDDAVLTPERIEEMQDLQKRLHAAGYAGFTFPVDYGGQALTLAHEQVFLEEASGYRLPNQLVGVSINILGATIVEFGSDEQKRSHVPRILSGQELWVQLLSEPSGGSDLAGLVTSASKDGDAYVINGQKTWSSLGYLADYGLCPVRTSWDVPKHRGISVLIIALDSPGVEVRRIRQITGQTEFCEVFLTDVRVPVANLVGEENEGWRILKGLLEIEHSWVGRVGGRGDLSDVFFSLIALAERRGLAEDPIVRRRLTELYVLVSAQKLLAQRVSEGTSSGKLPAGYGSLLKLGDSPLRQRLSEFALQLAGSEGVAWAAGSAMAQYADAFLNSRSATIAGGTTEMQRNNVSERILGLPREPTPFAGAAFKDVPHN